jgi:hypothetical protein
MAALIQLDLANLGADQRLDAIAATLGHASGAALLGAIDEQEAGVVAPAKKVRAVVAFGATPSRSVSDGESVLNEGGEMNDGDLSLVEFDTPAELKAYAKGVEDAEGWMDANFYAAEDDEPQHPIFKEIDKGLDVVAAYEAVIAAEREEDEE